MRDSCKNASRILTPGRRTECAAAFHFCDKWMNDFGLNLNSRGRMRDRTQCRKRFDPRQVRDEFVKNFNKKIMHSTKQLCHRDRSSWVSAWSTFSYAISISINAFRARSAQRISNKRLIYIYSIWDHNAYLRVWRKFLSLSRRGLWWEIWYLLDFSQSNWRHNLYIRSAFAFQLVIE